MNGGEDNEERLQMTDEGVGMKVQDLPYDDGDDGDSRSLRRASKV